MFTLKAAFGTINIPGVLQLGPRGLWVNETYKETDDIPSSWDSEVLARSGLYALAASGESYLVTVDGFRAVRFMSGKFNRPESVVFPGLPCDEQGRVELLPYPVMDPVVKAEWVEALESGDYKKGTGRLYDPDLKCHCVTGVLCDLKLERDETCYKYDGGCYFFSLPGDFADSVGLEDSAVSELVDLNDTVGMTFSDLALYIKENL